MKQRYFILCAAIAAALIGAPSVLLAQPAASSTALAGLNISEAPRVTQTVTNNALVTIPKTHLAFVAQQATLSTPRSSEATMNHLQLVLKPSVARQTAMETLIARQHDPKSAQFDQWLTPQQFGESFGVVDSDIAAVTAWLTAQGLTVNTVYPNKSQIDFSGTVAQVNAAFHTQENVYTINKVKYLSNASDISIPAALAPVVAGVMGLNDFHAKALAKKPKIAQWNASKKGFVAKDTMPTTPKGINQAVSFNGGTLRGLVPNDMVTMYGIRTIRNNGVTGKGVTIAVLEDHDMVPADWTNFVSVFNLGQYGGTFSQIHPAPPTGTNNCVDPDTDFGDVEDDPQTVLDAEWTTAIAPGANIQVAACGDTQYTATTNYFGGVFVAAINLINGATRPNIIDIGAVYGDSEFILIRNGDSANKTATDLAWAQADAEGISVFVATGDTGVSVNENEVTQVDSGGPALNANALATSPHVTAVGGTDLADVLRGTTKQYFAATPSVVGGSALSYVPEIPFNATCGNGVAAVASGFTSPIGLCEDDLKWDPKGIYAYQNSAAASGGPSSVDTKPAWQGKVYNAAQDQSRDVPDVSLFAGSWGDYTMAMVCSSSIPCTSNFSGDLQWGMTNSTSISSAMFAGIQALMDQGLAARGLPVDQGNAAPTLYALAADEYGGPTGSVPASLATCSADNGATGTANCVFHNVTSGSISTNCYQSLNSDSPFATSNCYFYGSSNFLFGIFGSPGQIGLTTSDAAPTSYGTKNKAYGAQPGWSFSSGLGSVNATNLLMAWRAFVNAPPAG